ASTKPPEQRHILEGFFGGPLGRSGKTSFMLSAHDRTENQQAVVYALGLDGIIHDTLPQSNREALVTGSITHQVSDRNTFSIRPNYQYESQEHLGAGGVTLASQDMSFMYPEPPLRI